jgi:hypothetical protein
LFFNFSLNSPGIYHSGIHSKLQIILQDGLSTLDFEWDFHSGFDEADVNSKIIASLLGYL